MPMRTPDARHLLAAVAAVLALSGSPQRLAAQYANTLGIYNSPAATGSDIPSLVPVHFYNVYFVLADPRDANGAPVTQIWGFEFHVTATGSGTNLLYYGDHYPVGALNIGSFNGWDDATFVVGYPSPVPVTNRLATLMWWEVFCIGATTPLFLYLEPATPASVPGQLAFAYASGSEAVLMGATGTQPLYTLPEFAFGAHLPPVVTTEAASFGDVKALFR